MNGHGWTTRFHFLFVGLVRVEDGTANQEKGGKYAFFFDSSSRE
jgi:hypothetical protein